MYIKFYQNRRDFVEDMTKTFMFVFIGSQCIPNTNTTAASGCQTLHGDIPGGQPEKGTDGYGGKDFEKRKAF